MTSLQNTMAMILPFFAFILHRCEANNISIATWNGDTTMFPIDRSNIMEYDDSMDAVRYLEEEEENVHTKTIKPFSQVLFAVIIVNFVSLVTLLSLIPILLKTKWSCFKSTFWDATSFLNESTDIAKKYSNLGRSPIKEYAKEKKRVADICVPAFLCGAILATVLFLVIPEAIVLIQHGTSSNRGEIEILPGTISRFGAAVMTGYILPLAFRTIFSRSSDIFETVDDKHESKVGDKEKQTRSSRPIRDSSSMAFTLPTVFQKFSRNETRNSNHQNILDDDNMNKRNAVSSRSSVSSKSSKSSRDSVSSKSFKSFNMPSVFQRLSQTETVASIFQKMYPVSQTNSPSPHGLMVRDTTPLQEDVIEEEECSTVDSRNPKSLSGTSMAAGDVKLDDESNIKEVEIEEGSICDSQVSREVFTDNVIDVDAQVEEQVEEQVDEQVDKEESKECKNNTLNAQEEKDVNSDVIHGKERNHDINFSLTVSIFIGNSMRNFFDGIYIGVAFMTCSTAAAVCVAMITIFNETSRKIANYFVLTEEARISIPRAVLFLFGSGLTVVVGALMIINFNLEEMDIGIFLAFASGTYIHTSASECLPRVYSLMKDSRDRSFCLLFFVIGALPIGLTLLREEYCD